MSDQGPSRNPLRRLAGLGAIYGLIEQVQLGWRLFRDPRVPLLTKAIPVATIIYLISPVDWLVNLIPILGQMEDIAVFGLGLTLFIRAAPQDVVNEHRAQLRGGSNPELPPGAQH